MFTAALFVTALNWKQPKHPSTDKLWHRHTVGNYSAIIERKVLIHATTWINLENIKLK